MASPSAAAAAASAASGGDGGGSGGGPSSPAPPIDDRVYRAVDAGESADEVKRAIEELAQGCPERRKAAVNKAGVNRQNSSAETPLEAAHDLRRGDLVAPLLEAGASAAPLCDGRATELALCIHYGLTDTLRALLSKGWVRPDEKVPYEWDAAVPEGEEEDFAELFWTPSIACVVNDTAVTPRAKQLECLDVLVSAGADIDARDSWDRATLHVVTMNCGDLDALAALKCVLSFRPNLELRDDDNETPIFEPVRMGDAPIVRELLAAGADANVVCSGYTLLMKAVLSREAPTEQARRDVIDALLPHTSVETRRKTVAGGRSAVDLLVQELRDAGAPLDDWCLGFRREMAGAAPAASGGGSDGGPSSPSSLPPPPPIDDRVREAVQAGKSLNAIKRLLAELKSVPSDHRSDLVLDWYGPWIENDGSGPMPMDYGLSPLQIAWQHERQDVAALLISAGANPAVRYTGDRGTALAFCIKHGLLRAAGDVLHAGKEGPNERFSAAWFNDYDESSDDESDSDDDSSDDGVPTTTALHACLESQKFTSAERLACLRMLVDAGADVDAEGPYDETALHVLVVDSGNDSDGPDAIACLDVLLAAGADLEAVDDAEYTPLFVCLNEGTPTMLRALLARGASCNGVENGGLTTLLFAMELNDRHGGPTPAHREMIDAILPHTSVETRRKTLHDGQSAVDLLVRGLRNAGAPLDDWCLGFLREMAASGVPFAAADVLPLVAARGERPAAELRWRRMARQRALGQEDVFRLAQDLREHLEDQEREERLEARVKELEGELRALGVGTEDMEEEEEGEDEDEEEGETSGEEPRRSGGSEEEQRETSGGGDSAEQ